MGNSNGKGKRYMLDHPVTVEETPRWVRVKFGGEWIADSKDAMLLIEYQRGNLPTYYFPRDDVEMSNLVNVTKQVSERGAAVIWDVKVGDKVAKESAWSYLETADSLSPLQNMISFKWHKMDAWYEEEEEVFVHARDPYKRIDVMPSSRHVKVVLDGVVLADTKRPSLLFETGLPVRYYIPREDVNREHLTEARGTTRCPYKGVASYWSVNVNGEKYENLVWSYPDPIPENPKIKDLLCFYNEKVDIYVDGELEERPQTHWS